MSWLLSFVVEGLYLAGKGSGRLRKLIGCMLVILILLNCLLVVSEFEHWFLLIIALLLPFRILNVLRVIKGRMHPNYLRKVTLRTGVAIAGLHLIGYAITMPDVISVWRLLPYILLSVAATMLALLIQHLNRTKHITNTNHFSDKELPTVSVCIPARNETDALEQCLRTVLANDYPKLEILVLDDCSQDRTAEVIKSFAHDGVRFIQGEEPSERWLAKNQAYDKLVREATGELILFCGVDVRFGTHAIRALVTTMLNREKHMISVMPLRFYSKLSEAFIQPMRYWWELVPPRKLVNRPPVLSTCWLVERDQLQKVGGFAAVSHTIIPEGYFARKFINDNRYAFIRADEEMDVRTAKLLPEQWSTAVRTNYPQIRRRPEMAFILTVFTFMFLILPFVLVTYGLLTGNFNLTAVSVLASVLLISTHVLILQNSDPANVPAGFFTLPIAAFIEVIIGYTSMLKYEFGKVEWKDRNICIPVMHTIPKKDFLANGAIK